MITSEGRTLKAIRLLKEQPFEFIDHGKYRGAMPENFEPKLGNENWVKATAVMAVIRSKPSTWQWNADRLEVAGHLTKRIVKEGVKKLKQEGWIHHANIYDERHKHMTTFVVAFSSPIPEHQRIAESRFTLIPTGKGWVFGYSRDGGRYAQHTGVGKEGSYTSVQQAYGHIGTVSRTQTLKRASVTSSDPELTDDNPEQGDASPKPATQEPDRTPESTISYRESLAKELEALGEKRDESEDAALAYEEFIVQSILPELALPPHPENNRPRRKLWNLHWMQDSLLGMILLRMSSSNEWDVQCARRVIKRANEGYIQWDDLRIMLFAFDWTRSRSTRRTLTQMTFYGKKMDDSIGRAVTVDAWARIVKSAKETYRRERLGEVLEQRNRLYPGNEEEMAVNISFCDRVMSMMKDICTKQVEPDEQCAFSSSILNVGSLSYMLSFTRRSEATQRKIDESHDKLVKFFATNYAGILVYRSKYHLLEDAMGVTLDEIKQAHRDRVEKISRRLSYHGLKNDEVVSYL